MRFIVVEVLFIRDMNNLMVFLTRWINGLLGGERVLSQTKALVEPNERNDVMHVFI
jgi:hypothetical protein